MRIGGLQKVSLIDYPGKLACVIFTQGCNFRCRYCHNPELVIPSKYRQVISEEDVLTFLEKRKEYIEGVVISGGEPTIQKNLIRFLDRIKRMGFLTKLDTNGSQPDVIEKLINLNLINYIAMDVKAPLHRYEEIAGVLFPVENIKKSIDIIIHSEINHEFRTTAVKHYCSSEDLDGILPMIDGAQKYYLQKARMDDKILDQSLLKEEQFLKKDYNRIVRYLEHKHLQGV